jgi:hypothetical protein
MSSSSTIVLSAIVAVLSGTAVAAWLTIRQKKQKRVQKRRADAYVEMLAWIRWGASNISLGKVPAGNPGAAVRQCDAAVSETTANNGDPAPAAIGAAGQDTSTITREKLPYAPPAEEDTGPDSKYHATLRGRIVAFGSHDMTRAFDRWTEAYRMILAGKGSLPCHVDPEGSEAYERVIGLTYKKAIVPDNKRPGTSNPQHRDPGFPDGRPGCLTRAIEVCASRELRKG